MTQDRMKLCETLKTADHPKQRELTEQELATVSGGFLAFTFKLVAVKTISWS
jgi:bacteriocin-like protein